MFEKYIKSNRVKNTYLVLFLFLFPLYISAGVNSNSADSNDINGQAINNNTQAELTSRPFITIWQTDNPGITDDNAIRIPAFGEFIYTWEEVDDPDNNDSGNGMHTTDITFPSPGKYRLYITPVGTIPFNSILFADYGDKDKIIDIEQWGDIEWMTLFYAYEGCRNLNISATDAPDLSKITTLSNMFSKCDSFNSNINHWDVSNVIDMSRMFYWTEAFNQPLDNWDVSNVVYMDEMFAYTFSFNQSLETWDVSSVKYMNRMFFNSWEFNGAINTWDVSNVTDMNRMFSWAKSFNQPLDLWDVSNITDMSRLFEEAWSFNQSLDTWDVSNVINMSHMFAYAGSFNQPLNNWDVSMVSNMNSMFIGAVSFNQPLDKWDVSNVTYMSFLFHRASDFNQDLNTWDVGNVTNMFGMFRSAKSFNQPLDSWDVSNVTNMSGMFSETNDFNQPLDTWDVSKVTDMSGMFNSTGSFNQPLNNWDVSKVTDMGAMFTFAKSFNQPLDAWDVSNVINMQSIFLWALSFNQSLADWNFPKLRYGQWLIAETGLSCTNYSKTLIGWAEKSNLPTNINLDGNSNLSYGPDAVVSRNYLRDTKGWTIDGDLYDPYCVAVYDQNCNDNIVHSGAAVPTGLYKTNKTIQSTANLTERAYYHAGQSITLTDGFKVDGDAVFEAKIKGCDD